MMRRGPKRKLDVESEYWRLVLSGVGTVAACKIVGITRKTGYRWRAEHGGRPDRFDTRRAAEESSRVAHVCDGGHRPPPA